MSGIRVVARGRVVEAVGRPVVIGRDPSVDLPVEDGTVSRRHAVLEPRPDGWYLTDTSANGTLVDGRPVSTLRLPEGRTWIQVGAVTVTVDVLPDHGSLPEYGTPAPGVPSPPPATTVRIGRVPGNELVIPELSVSRAHALLHVGPDGAVVEDAGSHNGTFVNGIRVRRASIRDGDLVTFGTIPFRYGHGRLEPTGELSASWLCAIGVTARRGKADILRGFNLAIPPASLVGIVGPSGAGKTTLVDTLTGYVPATAGTITYAGRELRPGDEEFRLRLGYVPQEDLLHSQLTVGQALDYAARLRFPPDVASSARRARIDEVLEELGISERRDLQVSHLSGGQRKRTSIAVELLTKPSVLFLDEPTSGLDPGNEELVMTLLHDLARGGRTVVVTTHALASLELCDRVVFLAKGGHLAYYGPPADAKVYFASRGLGDTYPRVFRQLEAGSAIDWDGAYASDPAHELYIRQPLSALSNPDATTGTLVASHARPSAFRQTAILIRRYLALIAAERRTLALLILQVPLFGLFFLGLFPDSVMSTAKGSEATTLLWQLVIAVTWLGTSNSIRELVKERAVVRREVNIGVSIGAYFWSKVLVLGAITIVQAIVLVAIALAPQVLPPVDPTDQVVVPVAGTVLDAQRVELAIGLALAGVAAMSVGLLMSAFVKSSDQAMLLLPVILVAQVVLSAPLIDEPSGPFAIGEMGASASWGMGAAAATVGLNELRQPFLEKVQALGAEEPPPPDAPAPAPIERRRWRHDAPTWGASMAVLALITVGALVLTYVRLLRTTVGKPAAERAG